MQLHARCQTLWHRTQSWVTSAIRALEREFGGALFDAVSSMRVRTAPGNSLDHLVGAQYHRWRHSSSHFPPMPRPHRREAI
jgi:DNA-binding transcriptional LysR family regulator